MPVLLITVIVVLGYLLGSIPFGLLVAQSQGVDLRAHGSGNIGATNVWRVMGKKWGLITFFADAIKGVIAVKLAMYLAAHWEIHLQGLHGKEVIVYFDQGFAGIAGAIACILGHNFPVWLKFKGGKGVATSLGVIFGMMPVPALIVFAIWGVVFKTSRYVSLASLIAAVSLPLVVVAFLFLGGLRSWAHFYFAIAAAIMVVRRHQPNIARLVAGTELRFGSKKAEEGSTKDTKGHETVAPAEVLPVSPMPANTPANTPATQPEVRVAEAGLEDGRVAGEQELPKPPQA